MSNSGFRAITDVVPATLQGRLNRIRDRHYRVVSMTVAVAMTLLVLAEEAAPGVQEFVDSRSLIPYLTLIVVLDLGVTMQRHHRSARTRLASNQDEAMPLLIGAVPKCRADGADLLEYAGATDLDLVRHMQRLEVPLRILVKHPDTITGMQRQRSMTTLDTIYTSIFHNYRGTFELRCYRLPYGLRARRMGNQLLEVGWVTPDKKRGTAYGHANPSILADLTVRENDDLLQFFVRTFDDYWNDDESEDGLAVLQRYEAPRES